VDFRIIWLLALGDKPEIKLQQFEMTLFGLSNIVDLNDSSNTMKPCFYFSESSFHRYRNRIDATVISTLDNAKLCINNHSPNYKSFKNSKLCASFGKAVVDPIEREDKGKAYIADSDISKVNKGAILKHIQDKYGRPKLMDLNFTHYSAAMAIPTNEII